MRFVFIAHYFPPVNSSGAKRVEALSKYLVAAGHEVAVITTSKTASDGAFTEEVPKGVKLIELSRFGFERPSQETGSTFQPMYTGKPSFNRRLKDWVMRQMGQLPDPRLPFSLAFLNPWLTKNVRDTLRLADVVIGSSPPWPMLLAALIVNRRFGVPCILDYRDHFSECHEMPGGPTAKWFEKLIDRRLVRGADHVVTISEPMTSYYRTMTNRITTIPNGYDHDVLEVARKCAKVSATDDVLIRYMGIVSPGRISHNFFQALEIFKNEQPARFSRIRMEFFGNAALVEQALRERYLTIGSAFHFFAAVPYLTSLQRIVESDYLLFCETSSKASISAQGILTTKLFEYIGSGRPVLADISSDTLAGSLLLRCGGQHVVSDTRAAFLASLRNDDFFLRKPDDVSEMASSLSRQAQAQQYAKLAAELVKNVEN